MPMFSGNISVERLVRHIAPISGLSDLSSSHRSYRLNSNVCARLRQSGFRTHRAMSNGKSPRNRDVPMAMEQGAPAGGPVQEILRRVVPGQP